MIIFIPTFLLFIGLIVVSVALDKQKKTLEYFYATLDGFNIRTDSIEATIMELDKVIEGKLTPINQKINFCKGKVSDKDFLRRLDEDFIKIEINKRVKNEISKNTNVIKYKMEFTEKKLNNLLSSWNYFLNKYHKLENGIKERNR